MRIIVHDYSGHPFQVQLSRELAHRGHDVLHLHCASYQTGKGAVYRRDSDPPNFEVEGLDLGRVFDRYKWVRRVLQEIQYGRAFTRRAKQFRPDLILSSNDPLFAKNVAGRWCLKNRVPWVFWLQDLYSVAMADLATAKLGRIGGLVGNGFKKMEARLLNECAAVVAITDDFLPILREWGVDPKKVSVIPNWAPLEEIQPLPRDNCWAQDHGLDTCKVVLYSGTLGLKHDPGMLLEVALRHRDDPAVKVVVVSQGLGAIWLREQALKHALGNLLVLPFQPYDRLPEVLATGDVLTALLTGDAASYSVPSKVLTYLCAARPVVAAISAGNQIARQLEMGGGTVVEPSDAPGFAGAIDKLLVNEAEAEECGRRARAYAEHVFDIQAIADRFEPLLIEAGREAGRDGEGS